MQWSPEQEQVIRHRDGNLLVSAAAGSGKTAVLVERIVQIALDGEYGTDIDRILTVTFTNLAAAQMKDRIYKRLQTESEQDPENERIRRQISLLSKSPIMTIHAFCLSVVHEYAALIPGLDPGFRVMDENEARLLSQDVMTEVLSSLYDRYEGLNSPEARNFHMMLDLYSGQKQDSQLEPLLLEIRRDIENFPNAGKWLENAVLANQDEHPELYSALQGVRDTLFAYEEAFRKEKLERGVVDYHDFELFAEQILIGPSGEPTEAAREIRDTIDLILIDEYQDSNEIQERILGAVARTEDGEPHNIFMVGDIKQSIYGFRSACPRLFNEKLENYREDALPRKIYLQRNFRSRKEVLSAVNEVFDCLMNPETGSIDYTQGHALLPGRAYQGTAQDGDEYLPKLQLLVTDKKPTSSEMTRMEAEYTADRIAEMLTDPERYQVYDKSLEGSRPVRAGDIAILLRAVSTAGPVYQKALEKRGIPAVSSAADSFFETEEIRIVMNLLRLIDNSHQDIPLEAVMHSFIFRFSSEDLAVIRTTVPATETFHEAVYLYPSECPDTELAERIRLFIRQVGMWRDWSESLRIRELLEKLYTTTGLYEYAGSMPAGARRKANLDLMLSRADAFETGMYSGVFQFLRFLDKMREKDADYEEAAGSTDQNAVRIMTIHKSKGLEFPVVFLCGIEKRFSSMDARNKILIDEEFGLGSRRLDPRMMTEYKTPRYLAIQEAKTQAQKEEEMRIFYTACTRAADRLILVGTCTSKQIEDKEKARDAASRLTPEEFRAAGSYLDWMLQIRVKKGLTQWKITEIEATDDMFDGTVVEQAEEEPGTQIRTEREEAYTAALLWKYPHAVKGIPLLLTVSQLKKTGEEDESGTEEDVKIDWQELLNRDVPSFEEGSGEEAAIFTGARGGTLFHRVLAQTDLTKLMTQEGRISELDRMCARGILTRAERDAFPMRQLAVFGESPLCRRMTASDRLLREAPFIRAFTPAELRRLVPQYPLPEEMDEQENIMIQGVLDAAFLENGAWVLVDYKTDRHFPEEVVNMYCRQLALYKEALSQITQIPVKEEILYAVRSGQEIRFEERKGNT